MHELPFALVTLFRREHSVCINLRWRAAITRQSRVWLMQCEGVGQTGGQGKCQSAMGSNTPEFGAYPVHSSVSSLPMPYSVWKPENQIWRMLPSSRISFRS